MVIIRTSATEVKTQAVSPELTVHFSATVAEQLGGAAGAAGAAAAGAVAAGAAAGAAGVVAAGAVAGLSCATAAGAARPMNMAVAAAAARPVSKRVSFMVQELQIWKGKRRMAPKARPCPSRLCGS